VSGPRLPYPLRDSDAQLFDCRLMVSMLRGGPCPIFVGDDSLVHRVRGWCFRCSFRTLPFSPLPGRLPRLKCNGAERVEFAAGRGWRLKLKKYEAQWADVFRHASHAIEIYCPAVRP
jgi:hypothetical protein